MLKDKKSIFLLIVLTLLTYIMIFHWTINKNESIDHITDVGRLMPTKIHKIIKGNEEKSIVDTVVEARRDNLKVSIAGKRHSQGGHTYYPDGIMLDMTTYDKVLNVDTVHQTVHVQSGATWDDIQKAINPLGLSVKVMQSQNIFTVGGSLSVNVHGRDIRNGSLIETVNWFRLLTPDGEIIKVSREENPEYFPLVIGGYGLFGVILDVELKLTNDELYALETEEMTYDKYENYFRKNVQENDNVKMHLGRLSTAPETFLKDMYVTNYVLHDDQEEYNDHNQLKEDKLTFMTKFLLGLSRDFDWGKNAFWRMQKSFFQKQDGELVTRNNVMRSESEFLEYEAKNDTDILQEYFIPVDEYEEYIDELREFLSEKDLNLMNITVRYVSHNEEAVLSYAKEDMFALVLLINQGKSEKEIKKTGNIIRGMIDLSLQHEGSYYLPYYEYPTVQQMQEAYPSTDEFFYMKKQLDPEERFMNLFFERYGQ